MSSQLPAPDPINVRAARANDVGLMTTWAEAMAYETEQKVLDHVVLSRGIAAGLADPEKAAYYVAEIAGQPVGTLMITREWSDWRDGWWWWIQSVYVPPEHRRSGVFRTLFDHVRGLAASSEGVRGLRLYVERENASALRTYQFVGMKDAGYRMFELELPKAP